jgi:hypothetical protein
MADAVQHKTKAVATGATMRFFDSGSEGIEITFDLPEPLPNTTQTSITGTPWMTTEKVQKRSKATLARVGADPEDPTYQTDEQLLVAICGKTFNLVLEVEPANEYHQRDKWVVRFINGPAKEAEPGSSSLLSKLRGRQAVAPSAPLTADPDSGGAYDDDVPF